MVEYSRGTLSKVEPKESEVEPSIAIVECSCVM